MAKERKLSGFASHRSCCAVLNFSEGGCKLIFPNRVGKWICLSGTNFQSSHDYSAKLCDLMFLWDHPSRQLLAAVLELKGGGVDIKGVVQQLQNGADIVADLAAGVEPNFLPVLMHRQLTSIQVNALRKNKIRFRGKQIPIALLRCGGKMSDLSW